MMKYEKRKCSSLIFLLIITVLLSVSIVHSSCLTSLNKPEDNRTYPYSIELPIEFGLNSSDCVTCYYNLYWADDNFDYGNTTIECDGVDKFDVDYNGNYTLTLYTLNTTAGLEENDTSFIIDRSEFEDSKPYAAFFGIIFLIMMASFIFTVGRSFPGDFIGLRLFFTFIPIIMLILAIEFAILVAREYIKVPSINESLGTLTIVFMWVVLFILIVHLFIYVFVKTLEFVGTSAKGKWFKK